MEKPLVVPDVGAQTLALVLTDLHETVVDVRATLIAVLAVSMVGNPNPNDEAIEAAIRLGERVKKHLRTAPEPAPGTQAVPPRP